MKKSQKKEPSEKKIEENLRKRIENAGGFYVKFIPYLNNGWPDRFIFMRPGIFVPVELKKVKNGVPTEASTIQKWVHKKLYALGFKVWVVYDDETTDLLMQYLLNLSK
jgi:hypothetical protein